MRQFEITTDDDIAMGNAPWEVEAETYQDAIDTVVLRAIDYYPDPDDAAAAVERGEKTTARMSERTKKGVLIPRAVFPVYYV